MFEGIEVGVERDEREEQTSEEEDLLEEQSDGVTVPSQTAFDEQVLHEHKQGGKACDKH